MGYSLSPAMQALLCSNCCLSATVPHPAPSTNTRLLLLSQRKIWHLKAHDHSSGGQSILGNHPLLFQGERVYEPIHASCWWPEVSLPPPLSRPDGVTDLLTRPGKGQPGSLGADHAQRATGPRSECLLPCLWPMVNPAPLPLRDQTLWLSQTTERDHKAFHANAKPVIAHPGGFWMNATTVLDFGCRRRMLGAHGC